MVKKKTTKQVRAIDRIIKFQLDDGIESVTISGKEALADLEIDNKNNLTLYLNADGDKLNEVQSLVPFITLKKKETGKDPNKIKTVDFIQDLTQFAIEIADNSNELASLIKTKSSIVLDLGGIVRQLLEIAGKLAELERKNQEQDERITAIEEKNSAQDNRLNAVDMVQEALAGKVTILENNIATVEENQEIQSGTLKNHSDRITVLESLKPSDGSFVGYAKLFKELKGFNTSFVFNEIPSDSVIFLSIFYDRGGIHHVFTRNWYVYNVDYFQAIIENENVNINYNGIDTLTVTFDNQALGFATVDVVSIRKEGLTNTRAYVSTE